MREFVRNLVRGWLEIACVPLVLGRHGAGKRYGGQSALGGEQRRWLRSLFFWLVSISRERSLNSYGLAVLNECAGTSTREVGAMEVCLCMICAFSPDDARGFLVMDW